MQDPPLWFSINVGLLLYLSLASLSYLVGGRVPKAQYKAELREFIAQNYKRERALPQATRRALPYDARHRPAPLTRVVVVAAADEERDADEERETRAREEAQAEREAYRQYFKWQAQPDTSAASAALAQLTGLQLARVKQV